MPEPAIHADAFKLFCGLTGRDRTKYSNVPLMLEFAEWYHTEMVRLFAIEPQSKPVPSRRPNCY